MAESKMRALTNLGQSIWLDYIDRPLLETDKLKNLIADGLRGMTSNPSIFNNAIGSSDDYDEKIAELKGAGKSIFEIYDTLTIRDIQDAADQFKGVYEETQGLDGYVSLEINPKIANEVDKQIEEGIRLHKQVNRSNIMIKVPSTDAGLPVIEELIARGINVNATLIFSLEQYEQVAKAYLRGLNRLARRLSDNRISEKLVLGQPPRMTSDLSGVRSVASVFISRIDAVVDKLIEEKIISETDETLKARLQELRGKAAVANAHIISQKAKEIFQSPEAKALELKGANIQRVLWASTGTKNPQYSDIKYVSELISAATVNTIPEKTLNAFLDHGEAKTALNNDVALSHTVIQSLKECGINIEDVCSDLLTKGVIAFEDAFTELFESIEKKSQKLSLESVIK